MSSIIFFEICQICELDSNLKVTNFLDLLPHKTLDTVIGVTAMKESVHEKVLKFDYCYFLLVQIHQKTDQLYQSGIKAQHPILKISLVRDSENS